MMDNPKAPLEDWTLTEIAEEIERTEAELAKRCPGLQAQLRAEHDSGIRFYKNQ